MNLTLFMDIFKKHWKWRNQNIFFAVISKKFENSGISTFKAMTSESLGQQNPPIATRGSQERRRATPEDFLFGKLIGEGSFSSVFLAKEIKTGREVAIKVRVYNNFMKKQYIEKINLALKDFLWCSFFFLEWIIWIILPIIMYKLLRSKIKITNSGIPQKRIFLERNLNIHMRYEMNKNVPMKVY